MKRLLVGIFVLFVSLNLFASEVLQKESHNSFEKTLKNLEETITKKGLGIFTKIDHKLAAEKKASMKMNPATVIIFGNPKVGTMLMNDNIEWSLELPLKIVVFETNDGKVMVRARTLATDIVTPKEAKKIEAINNMLTSLVNGN